MVYSFIDNIYTIMLPIFLWINICSDKISTAGTLITDIILGYRREVINTPELEYFLNVYQPPCLLFSSSMEPSSPIPRFNHSAHVSFAISSHC